MAEVLIHEDVIKSIAKQIKHIAIIMDGNRRWARLQNRPIVEGHKAGAETLKRIVLYAYENGIPYMSFYAFSTENWGRAKEEVDDLMNLFNTFCDTLIETFNPNSNDKEIRIFFQGRKDRLSPNLLTKIRQIEKGTKSYNKLTVNLCIDYSGKWDITQSCIQLIQKYKEDDGDDFYDYDIIQNEIQSHLTTSSQPDVDLLIRTGGEQRISNYFLWQIAYAELLSIPELWPDFNEQTFDRCLLELSHRQRRFGK